MELPDNQVPSEMTIPIYPGQSVEEIIKVIDQVTDRDGPPEPVGQRVAGINARHSDQIRRISGNRDPDRLTIINYCALSQLLKNATDNLPVLPAGTGHFSQGINHAAAAAERAARESLYHTAFAAASATATGANDGETDEEWGQRAQESLRHATRITADTYKTVILGCAAIPGHPPETTKQAKEYVRSVREAMTPDNGTAPLHPARPRRKEGQDEMTNCRDCRFWKQDFNQTKVLANRVRPRCG